MSLKYDIFRFFGLLLLNKTLNSVYAKVSYLCAGILCDKSAISRALVIFENLD